MGREGRRERERVKVRAEGSSEVHPDPADSAHSEVDFGNNPRCSGRCSGELVKGLTSIMRRSVKCRELNPGR